MSHRFIPAPGDPGASPDPSHALAIKRWAVEILGLGEDDTVTVSELTCRDAGCPLVETSIIVFGVNQTRQWKFVRPKVAVTRLMVHQTLASPPEMPRG